MPAVRIKKLFLSLIFSLLFISSTFSQGNLPYADGKFIHFGFSLGTSMMSFAVTPASNVRVSNLMPGFSVGVVSDMLLNRYLNVRFNPTLHFGDRTLNYSIDGDEFNTNINSVIFTIPLYLKYSAERKDNYRPYLIAGGGAYVDLGRDSAKPVLLQPIDAFVEFGVGCDIYFSFFKLAPELKFGIGMNNMMTPYADRTSGNDADNKKYSTPIEKLKSQMLTLTFNFE